MEEKQFDLDQNSTFSNLGCPACGKEIHKGHDECLACGVVVSKFNSVQHERSVKESVGGLEHLSIENIKALELRWKKLVVNYHDKEFHHQFMQACYKQKALPFAVHCYSRMLEIDSEDDIAQLMRRQALSMVTVNFDEKRQEDEEIALAHSQGIPLLKWVNWIGLFLSSFCIAAGTLAPQARNLIGLGVSFLVLFIALFIYRKK